MPALISDFDGVILDSEPAHEHAIITALQTLGYPITSQHFTDGNGFDRFIGRGDRECLLQLSHELGKPFTNDGLADALALKSQAFQSDACQALITPFPATLLLLRQAAAHMPIETVHRGLERFGLKPILSAIVTCDDVPNNKPHPAPYLAAARALGINPTQCTAIEDSPTGIASAKAAGLYTIAVAHSFPEHKLTNADKVFPSTAALRVSDFYLSK
jgi:beta-phosphoglucomutase